MKLLWKSVANLVLSLNVLVLFFFFFESRMDFPAWLQSFGRLHPLLLHLPIGVSVLALLFVGFEKHFQRKSFQKLIIFLLNIAALTASLTALMGLILGAEGGYDDEALERHRNAGVAMSLLSWVTLFIYSNYQEQKALFRSFLIISIACLIITGHLGSVITHGENYILEPLTSPEEIQNQVNDSTSLFRAVVFPIIENKCTSCHNPQKSKGDLVMTSSSKMARGGEHGAPWVAGAPARSLLMKRLLLPEEHKEHMPPNGKPQLNVLEVQLMYQWILSGADTTTAWTRYNPKDSVRRLAEKFIQRSLQPKETGPTYLFTSASEERIEKLNDPYRTITPIAVNEPALAANFFLRDKYQPAKLEELLTVKEQLVSLNLTRMPVTDADCKIIRQFPNLEKLNLNFSSISNQCLVELTQLEKLKSISVAGTVLDKNSMKVFSEFKSLKEVFIWNTKVSKQDVDDLSKEIPAIDWNMGYIPDEKEILVLTPPILVNDNPVLDTEEVVNLRHNFPGAIIRYTMDGTEPDSTKGRVFDQPLRIDGYTVLKTKACKDGWFCSNTVTYTLFQKGFTPTTVALLNPPNKDYRGEGSITLVDNKKGVADNFRGDVAWLGYREKPFAAEFLFEIAPKVKSITISYAKNVPSFMMPPERLELWAGEDAGHIKLISESKPAQPLKMKPTRMEAIVIPLKNGVFKYYKIIAHPVRKLPAWHSGKGEKGWVFIDEVFFN